MNERVVVLLGIVTAFVLATLITFATNDPATFVGQSPVGVAIFLVAGVGLPQYILYRRDQSNIRLGIALLSVAASATVLLGGQILFRIAGYRLNISITGLLIIVVAGVLLSAVTQAFVEGYRSAND